MLRVWWLLLVPLHCGDWEFFLGGLFIFEWTQGVARVREGLGERNVFNKRADLIEHLQLRSRGSSAPRRRVPDE